MTAGGASEVRVIARIALRKRPAPAREEPPVFHVFAEMYARSRSERRSPATSAAEVERR